MKNFYSVYHEAAELSEQVKDYTTPSVGLELLDTEKLYIGFRKPFNTIYFEASGNDVANTFTTEAYIDGSWQVIKFLDESLGFNKSGFFTFDKPDKWQVTTVGTEELFYIRLTPSVSHNAASLLTGVGILLANDSDLIEIRSNIVSKHNNGSSWVAKHQAARKYIIQEIRNKGNRIIKAARDENSPFDNGVQRFSSVTEFDLLAPFELRAAATYKCLAMVYLDELHDEENDKWLRQGKRYEAEFFKMMALFYLKLDFNDDGIESPSESRNNQRIDLQWP